MCGLDITTVREQGVHGSVRNFDSVCEKQGLRRVPVQTNNQNKNGNQEAACFHQRPNSPLKF